jgi:hypothetical protein
MIENLLLTILYATPSSRTGTDEIANLTNAFIDFPRYRFCFPDDIIVVGLNHVSFVTF